MFRSLRVAIANLIAPTPVKEYVRIDQPRFVPTPQYYDVEREYARLTLEQYKALEKVVPKAAGTPADPVNAAYLCGAEAVLRKLREGWVVGA